MMKEFQVNGRTYRYARMNAFEGHKLVLLLLKKAGPIISKISLDQDVGAMAAAFASIDGDPLVDIALPAFATSELSVDGRPLKTVNDIDANFELDDIGDLYEVAVRLIHGQVGPAFTKALTRFGAVTGK